MERRQLSLDRLTTADIEQVPEIKYVTIGAASQWIKMNATTQVSHGSALIGLPGFGKTPALRAAFDAMAKEEEQTKGVHPIPVWVVSTAYRAPSDFWAFLMECLHRAKMREERIPDRQPTPTTGSTKALENQIRALATMSSGEGADRYVRPIVFFIDDFDILAGQLSGQHFDEWRSLTEDVGALAHFALASRQPLLSTVIRQSGFDEVTRPLSSWVIQYHERYMAPLDEESAKGVLESRPEWDTVKRFWTIIWSEAGGDPELLAEATRWVTLAADPAGVGTAEARFRSLFRSSPVVTTASREILASLTQEARQAAIDLARGQEPAENGLILLSSRFRLVRKTTEGRAELFSDAFAASIIHESGEQAGSAPGQQAGSAPWLMLDEATRSAKVDGRTANLTSREYDLIAYLARRAPHPVPDDELLAEVWHGGDQGVSAVAKAIDRCREKIELDSRRPIRLVRVRGEGYCLNV